MFCFSHPCYPAMIWHIKIEKMFDSSVIVWHKKNNNNNMIIIQNHDDNGRYGRRISKWTGAIFHLAPTITPTDRQQKHSAMYFLYFCFEYCRQLMIFFFWIASLVWWYHQTSSIINILMIMSSIHKNKNKNCNNKTEMKEMNLKIKVKIQIFF